MPVHIVSYHHVIHSLRAKPQAFANLTYRDALFPRTEYRRCWDALTAAGPLRQACRIMVGLLWLAHDQTCEAELAAALSAILARGELPVLGELRSRFTRTEGDGGPDVPVCIPSAGSYDDLIQGQGAAA